MYKRLLSVHRVSGSVPGAGGTVGIVRRLLRSRLREP